MASSGLAAAAIAVMLLGSLSGCFLLPEGPDPRPSSSSDDDDTEDDTAASTPYASVGDCWQAEMSDLAEWPDWRGDDAVDCTERHQTYTYFVGNLNARIDDSWDGKNMSAELSQRVYAQCSVNLRKLGIPDTAYRVQIFFFVAPKSDWEDGDQSIRCDLGVSAIGTDWADPGLENLPKKIVTLLDDVDDNPAGYEFCLSGDGYGPYESNETIIEDCSEYYLWRFSENIYYDTELDDHYPSDEELDAFAEKVCTGDDARDGELPLYYVPSLEMWGQDYRYVECWYSTIALPSAPV